MARKTTSNEILRGDPIFKEMLRDIKIERVKRGRDKRFLSDKRLTLAIARIPKLKDILADADIK